MKNIIIFFSSSVVGKLFPFFLIPVLTGQLSTAEYGLWALFIAIVSFIDPVISCSAHTYLAKKYFHVSSLEKDKIIVNIIYLFMFNFIFTFSLSLIFYFFDLFSDGIFVFIPILCFLNSFIALKLLILRNENNLKLFSIIEISKIALSFSLSIVFIFYTNLSWIGCVYGFLIGTLLVSIISIYKLLNFEKLVSLFEISKLQKIYALSLPLLPVGIANVTNHAADKLIIVNMMGKDSLGLYAIGYSFAQLLSLVTISCIKYWSPICYKKKDIQSMFNFIAKSCQIYVVAIIPLLMISYYVINFFLFERMVDPKFYMGKEIILVVMIALAIQGLYFFSIPFYIRTNRTKALSLFTTLSAMINVILNIILIPIYGISGAAIATLISYLFLTTTGHFLNVRYIKKIA